MLTLLCQSCLFCDQWVLQILVACYSHHSASFVMFVKLYEERKTKWLDPFSSINSESNGKTHVLRHTEGLAEGSSSEIKCLITHAEMPFESSPDTSPGYACYFYFVCHFLPSILSFPLFLLKLLLSLIFKKYIFF